MSLKTSFLLPVFIIGFLSIAPVSTVKTLDKATWDIKEGKLISSWKEENIYLYALDWKNEEKEQSGVYKEIVLSIKGIERHFSCWKVDSSPTWKPTFNISDIDNDGKKELIVISTSGRGTGVLLQDVHVFKFDKKGFFYDVYVVDPIEGIYQNVKGNMTKKNGIATITVNVKGKDFTLTTKESSFGFLGNDVGFGSIVNYAVINNKLIVKVNAVVGFYVTCGYIDMDYVFENKRLKINDAYFEKVDSNLFNYQF